MITLENIRAIELLREHQKLESVYVDKLERQFKRLAYILKGSKDAWMYSNLSKDAMIAVLTKEDFENGLTGEKLIRDFYDMFQVNKPGTAEKVTLSSGIQIWLITDMMVYLPVGKPILFLYVEVGIFGEVFEQWISSVNELTIFDEILDDEGEITI